ncbi:hypothetical protein [Streptomyces sp. NPDC055056]
MFSAFFMKSPRSCAGSVAATRLEEKHVSDNDQREREGDGPLHDTAGDTPRRDGYEYGADGIGARADLVQAVVEAWTRISPTVDPATSLRSAGNGVVNSVDNLARLAALAVVGKIASSLGEDAGGPDRAA